MVGDFRERVRMADMRVAYRRVVLRSTLSACVCRQTRQRRPMRSGRDMLEERAAAGPDDLRQCKT